MLQKEYTSKRLALLSTLEKDFAFEGAGHSGLLGPLGPCGAQLQRIHEKTPGIHAIGLACRETSPH